MDMDSHQKKKWVTLRILTLYLLNLFRHVIQRTKLSTASKKAIVYQLK